MAQPGSVPSWLDPKARRADVRGEMLVGIGLTLASFMLPMGLALLAIRILAPTGTGGRALALAGVGFAVAVATAIFVAVFGEAWMGKRRVRRAFDRLEARGETILGGEAVGVTYADRRWRVDLLGDAWDWGALRFDFDRLSFVGEHRRFELRSSDLIGTEARYCDPGLGGPQPRLYLRYLREGSVESIGIDLPYAPSARRRIERVAELRSAVERWRAAPALPSGTRPSRAPRAEDVAGPRLSIYHRIGRPAKLLAALATIMLAIVVEIVLTLIFVALGWKDAGGYLGGLYVVGMGLWIFLAAKIEARLPARYRYRAAEEPDVRDALRHVPLPGDPAADETRLGQES